MSGKPLLDISDPNLKIVRDILRRHVPEAEVWAFGSRANWTAKEFSDLDLCIVTDMPVGLTVLGALAEDFADSELPWKVDVVDWAATNQGFRKIIKKNKVVVQKPPLSSGGANPDSRMMRFDGIAQLNPKRRVQKGSQVPFVEMAALPQHSRDIRHTEVDFRTAKGSGAHFQNGDTLLARITPCLENGKTAQVLCLDNQVVGEGSTEFIVLCGLDPADNDFVYYLSRDPAFREYAISRMEGTSGRQRVSWQSIAAYEFMCPSPIERRASARFLSEIDDRITLLRETNATLEAIAQGLFKSWFVDFDPVRAKMEGRTPEGMDEATTALFPDSFEESELGLVPKGWRVGTLADVASYQNGYAFKTKDWSGVGHPVIKIGNVKPGIIETTGASYVLPETIVGLDRFRLQRGDLLVGMTGYVGETGLVPEIEPAAYLNQRVGKISTENGISDLGFVYCIVRNPAYKTHAESKSHGSAQANVSGTDLMSYPTVLPSAVVLDVFNQILAVFIWQILVKYEESQTLAALRDTLLPRLISGQLRLTPSS